MEIGVSADTAELDLHKPPASRSSPRKRSATLRSFTGRVPNMAQDVAMPESPSLDDVRAVLQTLALDEQLKATVASDPRLNAVAWRVASRYVASDTLSGALSVVAAINSRGDRATIDYMGESCRDAAEAAVETTAIIEVANAVVAHNFDCSISLDLSHIGLVVSEDVCLANAVRIAETTALRGLEMLISMEGEDRVDSILRVHKSLCERFSHVGITVQARMRRTAEDLPQLLGLPGRIRLVKGAYIASVESAHSRGSEALQRAYLGYAEMLLRSGHLCSIATHDKALLDALGPLAYELRRSNQGANRENYEFETLLGIGDEQLSSMRAKGHPTREYVVFGSQWWLYTCNRIAEDPTRLFQALVDTTKSLSST